MIFIRVNDAEKKTENLIFLQEKFIVLQFFSFRPQICEEKLHVLLECSRLLLISLLVIYKSKRTFFFIISD